MATALVALATTTLASSSATVTFSSIPATYRDLRLVITFTKDTATNGARLTFNSDTAANYSQVIMYGNGSSALSATDGPNYIYLNDYVAASLTEITLSTVDIMDYSATDKHKTVLERGNRAGGSVAASAARWANTAAITSVQINTGSGTFSAGSTFSLYGVVS